MELYDINGLNDTYDSDNHIGVIGDWFLKPSIEGSILSGFALADVVGNKILKERHRKTPIAFAKYSCSDIGSFEGLQQAHAVVNKAQEHEKKVESSKQKKIVAKQSNKLDMLQSKDTVDGTMGQKRKTIAKVMGSAGARKTGASQKS